MKENERKLLEKINELEEMLEAEKMLSAVKKFFETEEVQDCFRISKEHMLQDMKGLNENLPKEVQWSDKWISDWIEDVWNEIVLQSKANYMEAFLVVMDFHRNIEGLSEENLEKCRQKLIEGMDELYLKTIACLVTAIGNVVSNYQDSLIIEMVSSLYPKMLEEMKMLFEFLNQSEDE